MLSEDTVLLRAIWSMTARQAFSVESLIEIVGSGEKQRRAFNMCDGTKTQGEIVKSTKIDQGNFSKTLARWIEAGIVLRLGEGRESRFLHVYHLSATVSKRARANQ
jgi:hypothetical protein